jgi:hypothetical protein
MTGKCLLACVSVLLASIISAELAAGQNAADRVPQSSITHTPAVRLPLTPALSATPGSTTQIFAGTRLRGRLRPSPVGLHSLVRSAGIIFSGQVISVHREAGDASGATIVTFHVEDAFRGAFPGESLTINEWAGLWTRGETYRVGERVLLFLYPRSRLGFTSPVHGIVGRFEMRTRQSITLNAMQTEFFSGQIEAKREGRVSYAELAWWIRRAIAAPAEMIRSDGR